jgi:hypothetical protein
MANLDYTRQDIVDLVRKLSTLQPYLSGKEQALLLAIFGLAAEHASSFGSSGVTLPQAGTSGQAPGAATGGQETIASLQQQLLSAYIPGNSFDSLTGGGSLTGRIGEDPGSKPQVTAEPKPGAQTAGASELAGENPQAPSPKTKNNKQS